MAQFTISHEGDARFSRTPDEVYVTDGINTAIPIGGGMVPMYLEDIHNMILHKNDILLVSYPRSGNTWLQRIMLALKEGSTEQFENFKEIPYLVRLNKCPFLEAKFVDNFYGYLAAEENSTKSYRLMKSHLPHWLAPRSGKGKIIIITRDPKDVLNSYYHFHHNNILYGPDLNSVDPDVFYQMFISGQCVYGDWVEWHKSWIDATDKNTLWIHYEDLLNKFDETIYKIAKFINVEVSPEFLTKIKEVASFNRMKKDIVIEIVTDHVRKGVIGDHVNLLDKNKITFLNEKCKDIISKIPK